MTPAENNVRPLERRRTRRTVLKNLIKAGIGLGAFYWSINSSEPPDTPLYSRRKEIDNAQTSLSRRLHDSGTIYETTSISTGIGMMPSAFVDQHITNPADPDLVAYNTLEKRRIDLEKEIEGEEGYFKYRLTPLVRQAALIIGLPYAIFKLGNPMESERIKNPDPSVGTLSELSQETSTNPVSIEIAKGMARGYFIEPPKKPS